MLHFLIIGALLFAAHGLLQRDGVEPADEIVLSRGQQADLHAQFARTWQRQPSEQEAAGLAESWIREEVFYREGLVLGMDRDDAVVRRRIAQKMEFIASGQANPAPDEAELQAWLDAHPDDYRIEPRYSLRQIYYDPAGHGEQLEADLDLARAALERGEDVAGDSGMLPAAFTDAAAFELERIFGAEFVQALSTLPVGGWRGPVKSGLGVHLVELQARVEGRAATLAEVREAVQRDVLQARAQRADEDFYRQLRARYSVRIEADVPAADPAGAATASAQ